MSVRREDIEEVVNDTFWVVWTKAGEFRGASQLSTWIIGIAYRRALNALRRAKIRPVSDEPFDEDSVSVASTDEAETDEPVARARPVAPAGRAAHGARTHLHSRPFLRGSGRDPRLPGEHREDPAVPRTRDSQTSVARPCGHVRRKFMSPRIPDTHAEAWALLPWLANGRIQASDREWVEAHVAVCAECRAELAAQRDDRRRR